METSLPFLLVRLSKNKEVEHDDETDSCAIKTKSKNKNGKKLHPDERLRDLQEHQAFCGLGIGFALTSLILQLSYLHFRDYLSNGIANRSISPFLHALDQNLQLINLTWLKK